MNVKRTLGIAVVLGIVASAAYLATVGCCQLMGWGRKTVSLTAQLGLSGPQKKEVAELERAFLVRKQAGCEALCAKRAQMIRLLQRENPDRRLLAGLVEEIGTEQAALERATLDHLLAVLEKLDPAQRRRMVETVVAQLRTACRATACGTTAGCFVTETKPKR